MFKDFQILKDLTLEFLNYSFKNHTIYLDCIDGTINLRL